MRAHPRSRGENFNPSVGCVLVVGSSPLTRGKRVGNPEGRGGLRLIPAHAGKTRKLGSRTRCRWAHPRSRGENDAGWWTVQLGRGSSPLTRGKPRRWLIENVRGGLIPAHAGKTVQVNRVKDQPRAHPRSRGENISQSTCVMSPRGSSPLTRGKRYAGCVGRCVVGLIPAHAGKTLIAPVMPPVGWAHPRSRGENSTSRSWALPSTGSSPLTRGKRPGPPEIESRLGLIPAHAGKTTASPGESAARPAHPRSRGENLVEDCSPFVIAGSSPLTRGKRGRHRCHKLLDGLIPAHAGKTDDHNRGRDYPRAHPRSRGENALGITTCTPAPGSSPLTRGKLDSVVWISYLRWLIPAHAGKTAAQVVGLDGIKGSSPLTRGKQILVLLYPAEGGLIPAHAGKTRRRRRPPRATPAHPRSRGENASVFLGIAWSVGSSPLTRGKLDLADSDAQMRGLIPAHAGKTWSPPAPGVGGRAHPRSRGENADQ